MSRPPRDVVWACRQARALGWTWWPAGSAGLWVNANGTALLASDESEFVAMVRRASK
jgi:hypothetical protein